MSKGLVKAKKYDWKDSNLALFGSDTDKAVKKESAECEPAWAGAGQEVGLKIWRIVKFEVKDWPEEDYGKFYSGDSYIILNTYKEGDSDELLYDVHFWIGKYSTQDEYGTAAYKTVELDTFLDDKAIQHREVMGCESPLFKSYFKGITLMKGGADTGFRHVQPEEYKTRLLHFSRAGKTVTMKEVPCNKNKLNSGDVFIIDAGRHIWTWVGAESNKDEKFHAAMAVSQMKQGRAADDETIEEGSEPSAFFDVLLDEDDDDEDDEVDAIPDDCDSATFELYRVSDASGYLEFSKVKEGGITRDDFGSDDVFLFNTGKECFIFIGSGASPNESKNGMGYAHAHLAKRNQGLLPVSVLREGRRCDAFDSALAA